MPKVQAYVYDVTQGMAKAMSMAMVGKQIDIVPHTGIVVFGKEYYFGGGPEIGMPGKTVPCPVAEILELGETDKTVEELEAHINSVLRLEHTQEKYNLLSHNCNHYANDVAKFLLGTGIPDRIVNCAEEALSTPQGQNLRVMIEGMEASMRSQGNAGGMNPYANTGAGPAPAAASFPTTAATTDPPSDELVAALQELAKSNPVETRRVALQTMLKITDNVVKDPNEPKFRKIKMSNPAFSKKVSECTGGNDVILAAGWMPDETPEGDDVWALDEDAAKRQTSTKKLLEAELAKLPAAPAAAAPAPAPSQPTPYGGMPGGGMPGGFPGGGMPGGFPGGLPPGGFNPQQMAQAQQMMQNPQMMAQAQQMMQNNPQMMAQAQQMMQDPQMMAQMQQMMQDPQMMAQMQQMMGGAGRGGGF